MSDTPTPAELARLARAVRLVPEGVLLSGDDSVMIAAALSRLSQAEQERDASDAALGWVIDEGIECAWPTTQTTIDARAACERHKRSRQQRGGA